MNEQLIKQTDVAKRLAISMSTFKGNSAVSGVPVVDHKPEESGCNEVQDENKEMAVSPEKQGFCEENAAFSNTDHWAKQDSNQNP